MAKRTAKRKQSTSARKASPVEVPLLGAYLDAFEDIEGMFSPDAALMFMAYSQLIAEAGIHGDVLEIGVHHGLSAIAVAALRSPKHRFVAIDLFDHLQSMNSSRSGLGSQSEFVRNLSRFYPNLDFVHPIARPSDQVDPNELGRAFSFCHIDGGHSAEETYSDLCLCSEIASPGALIALDDYFNPSFPGVCEGGVKFFHQHPDAFIPIAIGFNKLLFQKRPAPFDLNERFASVFSNIGHSVVTLWEQPANLFGSGFRPFIDIPQSTPRKLQPIGNYVLAATIVPPADALAARAKEIIKLPVRVTNQSSIPFAWGSTSFAISYHLLSADGDLIRFDNTRTFFREPLLPNAERTIEVSIVAPDEPGSYVIQLDIVWEGVTWLHDKGSATPYVRLNVSSAVESRSPRRDPGRASSS